MYTTIGSVCGTCGHKHRTLRTALDCLRAYEGAVQKGNPGGNSYSDRGVCHADGSALSEEEFDDLYAIILERD